MLEYTTGTLYKYDKTLDKQILSPDISVNEVVRFFRKAEPQLLEPIYDLEVVVPEEVVGDVMGDLQTRRSLIMGIDTKEKYQVIKARTPLAELDRYSTTLRSLSQGRGTFTQKFAEFVVVPMDLQMKLAKETKVSELELA